MLARSTESNFPETTSRGISVVAECYLGLQCSQRALTLAALAANRGARNQDILAAFMAEWAKALFDDSFVENKLQEFHRGVTYI